MSEGPVTAQQAGSVDASSPAIPMAAPLRRESPLTAEQRRLTAPTEGKVAPEARVRRLADPGAKSRRAHQRSRQGSIVTQINIVSG